MSMRSRPAEAAGDEHPGSAAPAPAASRVGTKFGRKPKLNATQQRRARDLLSEGEPVRRVADEMNVHYSTISRLQR